MTQTRLRHLAQINPSCPAFDRLGDDGELTFLPMEAVWPDFRLDLSRRRRRADVAVGYTRFQDGDVLVPKITPTFEAARSVLIGGLLNGVGAGTTELHVLRPGSGLDSRFLLYIMNTHRFLKLGKAVMYGVAGQQRVPDDFFRDLEIDLPPLEEQRRIADFLDAETAVGQKLGRRMLHQLDVLAERRRRAFDLIWRGVGATPRRRLGYATTLVTSGSRNWGDYVRDSGMLFFRSANLGRDSLAPNLSSVSYVRVPSTAAAEAKRSRIAGDDVLVGITGANTGWVTLADGSVSGGSVSQHVCLVRPVGSEVLGRWLAYVIASPTVQSGLTASQCGGMKTQLSLPDIRDLKIPVFTLEEQRKIVARIDLELEIIDRRRELRNRQFELLGERRQALVTAAVTGRIDVSTASGRGMEV